MPLLFNGPPSSELSTNELEQALEGWLKADIISWNSYSCPSVSDASSIKACTNSTKRTFKNCSKVSIKDNKTLSSIKSLEMPDAHYSALVILKLL